MLPYRARNWLRIRLPWALIGLLPKGRDCETAGAGHEYYCQGAQTSACYDCRVTRPGQLWRGPASG